MFKTFVRLIFSLISLSLVSLAYAEPLKPHWAFQCWDIVVGFDTGKAVGKMLLEAESAKLKVRATRDSKNPALFRFKFSGRLKRSRSDRGFKVETTFYRSGVLQIDLNNPHVGHFVASHDKTKICQGGWLSECRVYNFGDYPGLADCHAVEVPVNARAGH